MYQKYLNGSLDDSNIFKFWAIIILVYLPLMVLTKIIMLVVFHIIEAIVLKAKGRNIMDEVDITDERDKFIQMKSYNKTIYVFMVGFIIALFTQLFDISHHIFFFVLVVTGIVADVFSEILIIRSYRRGV